MRLFVVVCLLSACVLGLAKLERFPASQAGEYASGKIRLSPCAAPNENLKCGGVALELPKLAPIVISVTMEQKTKVCLEIESKHPNHTRTISCGKTQTSICVTERSTKQYEKHLVIAVSDLATNDTKLEYSVGFGVSDNDCVLPVCANPRKPDHCVDATQKQCLTNHKLRHACKATCSLLGTNYPDCRKATPTPLPTPVPLCEDVSTKDVNCSALSHSDCHHSKVAAACRKHCARVGVTYKDCVGGRCLELQRTAAPTIGYIPQCTSDGTFTAQQCDASSGYCWCVHTWSGEELNNTRVAPGSPPPQCPHHHHHHHSHSHEHRVLSAVVETVTSVASEWVIGTWFVIGVVVVVVAVSKRHKRAIPSLSSQDAAAIAL